MKAIFTIPIFALLLACQSDQGSSPEVMNNEQSASAQSNKDDGQMSEGSSRQQTGSSIIKSCDGVQFSISKEGDERVVLTVNDASGKRAVIQPPSEMHEYQPVGLGCSVSGEDRKPYFVVQYGELEGGCSFCEWFYLYDAQGKQLNRSEQIIKQDTSLPEGQQQYPNNEEYEAMLNKLKFQHPEMDFVE